MKINTEIAEIIGLLCAEGSYHNYSKKYWEYYKDRNKHYFRNRKTVYIQFANYDKKLLAHFRGLIKRVYNYDASLSWDRIRICKRRVIKNLLNYTKYGHLKWKIPKDIINGSKIIKIRFLRGYFDGDGTAVNSMGFFSTNKKSLKKVSMILKSLSVENTFNGPIIRKDRKPSYYIYIRRKHQEKFLKMINPVSKLPKKVL
mgnify:CR=1 FL=1